MKYTLWAASIFLCSNVAFAESSPAFRTEQLLATKINRAFYDVERAFLRYHAKADPNVALPLEIKPLFPGNGFTPALDSFTWQISPQSDTEILLCFKYDYGSSAEEKNAATQALLNRGFSLTNKCGALSNGDTAVVGFKSIKRASIMTVNKLPEGVVSVSSISAQKPVLSFKAKTGLWSNWQTLTLYKKDTLGVPPFARPPLISKVTASDSFIVDMSCMPASWSYDICYLDVAYQNNKLDASKLGTLNLTFSDGKKAVLSLLGEQQLVSKPSKAYLDWLMRTRRWH